MFWGFLWPWREWNTTTASYLPSTPATPYSKTSKYTHDTVLAAAHHQQQQTLGVGVWDVLREEDIFWSRLKGSAHCTCKHIHARTHTHTHTHTLRQMLNFFPAIILFAIILFCLSKHEKCLLRHVMWLSLQEREMQTCEWWIHMQPSAWEHTQSLAGKPPTQAHTYSESAYGNTHRHTHRHTHTHTHTHLSTEDRKQPTQLVFTKKRKKKEKRIPSGPFIFTSSL